MKLQELILFNVLEYLVNLQGIQNSPEAARAKRAKKIIRVILLSFETTVD